jgi:hypothetical protein
MAPPFAKESLNFQAVTWQRREMKIPLLRSLACFPADRQFPKAENFRNLEIFHE